MRISSVELQLELLRSDLVRIEQWRGASSSPIHRSSKQNDCFPIGQQQSAHTVDISSRAPHRNLLHILRIDLCGCGCGYEYPQDL